MRKRTARLILILMALGLLGAGAILMLQGGGAAPPVPGAVAAGSDGVPEVSAILASASEAVEDGGNGEVAREEALRSEVQADVQGTTLRVLAREGRAPLPGATVFYLDRDQARRLGREHDYAHESEAAEREGTVLVADAQGVVVLPPSREDYTVAGRFEELYGATRVGNRRRGRRGGDEPEQALLLGADQTVVIRTVGVGGDGREGVPISVYQGEGWDDARSLWSGESGTGGLRELRHFQLLKRSSRRDDRFAAAVRAPFFDPVAAEFDGELVPEVRIELRLPQNGVLEVALADGAGEPLAAEAGVQLEAVRPEGYAPDLPLPDDFDELDEAKGWGEEAAVFPLVGVGLELRPRCELEDSEDWRAAPFPGPVAHAQRLRVTVALATDQAVLAGRIHRADGRPLAGGRVTVELRAANGRVATATIDTGGQGAFEWGVEPDQPDPPYRLDLRLQGPGDTPPEALSLALPVLQVGRRQDLGDLLLEDLEVLAWGRVVDDRGEPVSRADVRPQRYEGRSLQRPEPAWRNDGMLRARTGEDGSFEILARPPGGRLRLRATRSNHLPAESRDLQPGSMVELVLVREAELSGTARVPDWLRRDLVRLHLVSRLDGGDHETGLRPRNGRARFSFDDLAPGTYDLRAELRGEERPFLRVEGLTVGPGDEREAPRLQDLDLTGLLHRYVLSFVDPAGAPASLNGSLLGGLQPGAEPFALRVRGDGVEFISSRAAVELTLLAGGYRPETLTVASGERQVPVQRGASVEVVVPGVLDAVGGRRVAVAMALVGETGLPDDLRGTDQVSGRRVRVDSGLLRGTASADLGDGDRASFRLPRGGTYRVELQIFEGRRRRETAALGSVEVAGPGAQRFELAPEPGGLAAALARLGQGR